MQLKITITSIVLLCGLGTSLLLIKPQYSENAEKIEEVTLYLEQVIELSSMVIDLNIESVKTQTELWEYANLAEEDSPSDVENHFLSLNYKINSLVRKVRSYKLYKNTTKYASIQAVDKITQLLESLDEAKLVQKKMLDRILDIKKLQALKYHLFDSPNHELYMTEWIKFQDEMDDIEDDFEDSKVNIVTAEFMESQKELIRNFREQRMVLRTQANSFIYSSFFSLAAFAFFIALLLGVSLLVDSSAKVNSRD